MKSKVTVGLLLPRYFKFYAHEVVTGMVEYASQHQHIHFLNLQFNTLESAETKLRDAQVDGLILGLNATEYDTLKNVLPRNTPMINLHPAILHSDIPTVCVDIKSKCRVAFDYLTGLGYRHMASFGDSRGGDLNEVCDELEKLSFERSLSHHTQGIALPRSAYNELDSLDNIARLDKWLKSLPKPVGIVIGGGYSAAFLEKSVSRLGFNIPGDIAILSQSDDEICLFADPPISAIRNLGPEVGGIAIGILDETLSGCSHPKGRITIASSGVIERRSTGFPAGIPDEIKCAIRYIRTHACEGIGVDDVLRHVRIISRTRLYENFPLYFNHSPAAEIMRVRIDAAKHQLINTNLSVGMIGEKCGFSSHSQFTDAFRREMKISPLAWRKQHSAG